jgi:putative Ca2+/H+ antiporter (TMEM165/GDT1 family)
MALFMSDTSYLVTAKSKWAVVFGTLIGFIMISIIVIVGSVLSTPPHRTLVSNGQPFDEYGFIFMYT